MSQKNRCRRALFRIGDSLIVLRRRTGESLTVVCWRVARWSAVRLNVQSESKRIAPHPLDDKIIVSINMGFWRVCQNKCALFGAEFMLDLDLVQFRGKALSLIQIGTHGMKDKSWLRPFCGRIHFALMLTAIHTRFGGVYSGNQGTNNSASDPLEFFTLSKSHVISLLLRFLATSIIKNSPQSAKKFGPNERGPKWAKTDALRPS